MKAIVIWLISSFSLIICMHREKSLLLFVCFAVVYIISIVIVAVLTAS
jgi:hypothetical protein